jgi:lipopolysaccharide/colanic/teichoic acid biosynthesis glycosyltransferase
MIRMVVVVVVVMTMMMMMMTTAYLKAGRGAAVFGHPRGPIIQKRPVVIRSRTLRTERPRRWTGQTRTRKTE